jgi:uncharacterized protein
MTITPKTTVHTLLKEYPFLLDYLVGYNPEFRKLTNPVMRRTMGRMATLQKAAEIGSVPLNELMNGIAAEVEARTGTRPGVGDTAAAGIDPARQEALKQIITDLHAGRPMDELTQRFGELIEDIDASEIAAMEQALIDEGMPADEVKRLCDVHVQVFSGALDTHERVQAPAGHPVDSFQRENDALGQITQSLRKVTEKIGTPPDATEWARLKDGLAGALDRLLEIERHYLRKENQLFPFLEAHGVEGPSKVMWALHDDIRTAMKEARAAIVEDDAAAAVRVTEVLVTMCDDMVTKEEKVLLPMAMEMLTDAEWIEIRRGENEIGYALISEPVAWPRDAGAAATPASAAPVDVVRAPDSRLALKTGELSLERLNQALNILPLDFSVVDENDRVLYYSEGDRIFPRSPGVIGRKVQNCHPPASVEKVQQIVDAFRAGEKDVAEFWLEIAGRFLHIRYFALRDGDDVYRGVVETVQDVTGIRALEGQRRLLDW